jgi:hypothetical protein
MEDRLVMADSLAAKLASTARITTVFERTSVVPNGRMRPPWAARETDRT